MAKLDDRKIRWIIREKSRGMRTGEVALVQRITPRRMRQLSHAYRHESVILVLKKPELKPLPRLKRHLFKSIDGYVRWHNKVKTPPEP